MQRIRHVKERAAHGGKVCGPETQSRECGMEACDRDCQLSSWSSWSSCSKACDGGFVHRTRRVVAGVVGLGKCADEDSESRLQYRRCNLDKCKPKAGKILKCASTVDVVILLDASGSLGKEGFETVKKAGVALVEALDPKANNGNGAQVAVLAYSGPTTMDGYKKCTGQSSGKVDMAKDCNMIWLAHYTPEMKTVAAKIGSFKWSKGATMTSQALASAEAELIYGRANTESKVIVIADKLPMMPRKVGEAAASLRKKAGLLWVAATGPTDLQKFASWASKPVADNLVYIQDVKDLEKPHTLNKIIADTCSKVE